MNKRQCFVFVLLSLWIGFSCAQEKKAFTLEHCYALAEANYPLIKKRDLIDKSTDYSIANAAKGYLPQLSINGQATYQSAVTQIPIDVPGVEVPQLTKDQYKIYGEVNQTIYDGGAIKQKQALVKANTAIEEQHLNVGLHHLKERVHQLFFGILLVKEQLKQHLLLIKDIDLGIAQIQGAIAQGTALQSEAAVLQAERMKALQQDVDLNATYRAYLEMLGMFLDQPVDTATNFVKPAVMLPTQELNRPELHLFQAKLQLLDVQEQSLMAQVRPKFDFFFQGGYGRPALNILKPRFEAYYIGGLRVRWNLASLYTLKNEKAQLENNRLMVAADQETFLFDTQYRLKQERAAISRYHDLLQTDDAIITLRQQVKNAAAAQLAYGVITTSEYMREVHAEDQARLSKIVHEIQLLAAQYTHRYITGN